MLGLKMPEIAETVMLHLNVEKSQNSNLLKILLSWTKRGRQKFIEIKKTKDFFKHVSDFRHMILMKNLMVTININFKPGPVD